MRKLTENLTRVERQLQNELARRALCEKELEKERLRATEFNHELIDKEVHLETITRRLKEISCENSELKHELERLKQAPKVLSLNELQGGNSVIRQLKDIRCLQAERNSKS